MDTGSASSRTDPATRTEHPRLRATWLLDRRSFGELALAYIGLTAVWYVNGWSITHTFTASIGHADIVSLVGSLSNEHRRSTVHR